MIPLLSLEKVFACRIVECLSRFVVKVEAGSCLPRELATGSSDHTETLQSMEKQQELLKAKKCGCFLSRDDDP